MRFHALRLDQDAVTNAGGVASSIQLPDLCMALLGDQHAAVRQALHAMRPDPFARLVTQVHAALQRAISAHEGQT